MIGSIDRVKTLLIEDSPDDARIMQRELANATRVSFDVEWVERLDLGLDFLTKKDVDVVLLDLSLPNSFGADTLRQVLVHEPSVPIVVLTGHDDEAMELELLKEGAQDYLVKGHADGNVVVRSVLYAIERHRLLAQLQSAKESAEARLRVVVGNTPVIMFALDRNGTFTLSEGKGLEALGREPGQVVGKSIFDIYRDVPEIVESVQAALSGEPRGVIVEVDGVTTEAHYEPLHGQTGEIIGVVGVAHDITERRRLEERFLQSQKMEVVGQMAGGIAHDFNNLLTVILSFSELSMATLSPEDQASGYLREVVKASRRAADLTRQLLAFSRRQLFEPKVINLNHLIMDMDKMLRRLIGENIELAIIPGPGAEHVRADPGHLEQVLMNLAVNSRDAMTNGGKMIIETGNASASRNDGEARPDLLAGDYVTISVADTGVGMTEEVKAHAFKPFFTTKKVGAGSGLGLSTCYGLVKQSGGDITIDSEQGQGTTFSIYLPAVEESASPTPDPDESEPLPTGHEMVLLVEDEPTVRKLAANVLRQQGYDVLEAANGHEALNVTEAGTGGDIDLLVTDVVMPVMGGGDLADRIQTIYPNATVIFTSGYQDDTLLHQGVRREDDRFLQKPFTPGVLARKVREVLERRPSNASHQLASIPPRSAL